MTDHHTGNVSSTRSISTSSGSEAHGGENVFHSRAKILQGADSRKPPEKTPYGVQAARILGAGPGFSGEGHACSMVPGNREDRYEVTECSRRRPKKKTDRYINIHYQNEQNKNE